MNFTTVTPTLVKSGLDKIIDISGKQSPAVWRNYVMGDISSNGQKYVKIESFSGVGLQVAMNEGATHPVDAMETPYDMEVTPQQYGLAIILTELAIDTDYYGKLKEAGMSLAQSRKDTESAVAANVLNLGFTDPGSGGPKTLDNVAFFSASHTAASGTQSNLNTSLALSQANLETAVAAARRRYNHRGVVRQYLGPLKLIVPPALEYLALRLTNSALIPGSANNDKNVLQGMQVIVDPFLTSTTSWFLCASNPANTAIHRIQGAVGDYSHAEKIYDPRIVKYTNGAMYAFCVGDWRGMHGCQA